MNLAFLDITTFTSLATRKIRHRRERSERNRRRIRRLTDFPIAIYPPAALPTPVIQVEQPKRPISER